MPRSERRRARRPTRRRDRRRRNATACPAAGSQRTCWTWRVRVCAVDDVGLGLVVVVAGLGGPVRVDLRVERPVRQVDAAHGVGERAPLRARSARATACRTTRGCRRAPAASRSSNGSTLSGRNAALISSYGTSCAEPQNSQRLRLTRTDRRPRSPCSSGICTWSASPAASRARRRGSPRSAATRSCSTITPVRASSVAGDSVPQNGQTSVCFRRIPDAPRRRTPGTRTSAARPATVRRHASAPRRRCGRGRSRASRAHELQELRRPRPAGRATACRSSCPSGRRPRGSR